MTRDTKLYLNDMIQSIRKIERYTNNITFEEFINHEMAIDAVIRNFEIIGEAAGHIPDEIRSQYSAIPWSRMKAMRNIMAHTYFHIDTEIIWDTCTSLSTLTPLIEHIIDDLW